MAQSYPAKHASDCLPLQTFSPIRAGEGITEGM